MHLVVFLFRKSFPVGCSIQVLNCGVLHYLLSIYFEYIFIYIAEYLHCLLNICSTKCMDSLTFKCHSSFQNENNRKATHSFAP